MTHRILFLFLFCCQLISAQQALTGTVVTLSTHQPVERASVYIDGTSNGTYTKTDGTFRLMPEQYPCKLIISHIGCKLLSCDIKSPTNVTVMLEEKNVALNSITIKGNVNKRSKNLKEFSEAFLGTDKWGKRAKIKNDSVLYFYHTTDSIRDSTGHFLYASDSLHAICRQPLEIELGLTGYTAMVDIERFCLISNKNSADCDMVIHTRFIPATPKSKSQEKRFRNFRREAYFNSQRHFLRSLFENSLSENGYTISGSFCEYKNKTTDLVNLESFISLRTRSEIVIRNMKDKLVYVKYFDDQGDHPLNLTDTVYLKNTRNIWLNYNPTDASKIIFKTDSCIIRRNGTMPAPMILFMGKFAEKRIGAIIPDDYMPEAYKPEEN